MWSELLKIIPKSNKWGWLRNFLTASFILFSVQLFTIGVLSERLPIDVARPYYQETRSFTFNPQRTLVIDNVDGAITISSAKGSKIIVHVDVKGYPRRFKDREKVMKFAKNLFQIIESENRISIETEPRSRPEGVEFRADYSVTIPEGINIEINVMGRGGVYVYPGARSVQIRSNQGDVFVDTPTGDVFVQTLMGRIDVRDAKNEVELHTVNGSIYTSLQQGNVKCSAVNGNIQVVVMSKNLLSCDLSTTNGNLTLTVPDIPEGKLMAKCQRGQIVSDFPLGEITSGTPIKQIEFSTGKGPCEIKLTTMNGKISITRLIQ